MSKSRARETDEYLADVRRLLDHAAAIDTTSADPGRAVAEILDSAVESAVHALLAEGLRVDSVNDFMAKARRAFRRQLSRRVQP